MQTAANPIVTWDQSYTVSHFREEEAFMAIIKYSDLEEHRKKHVRFVQRISEARQAMNEGQQVSLQLLNFLRDWLVQHIKTEDQKYAGEFARGGVHKSEVSPPEEKTGFLRRFFSAV